MSKKILIIEDDQHLTGIYNKKLAGEGFDVIVARDGKAGLKLAAKEAPDLIILDLLLPRMPGIEVLKNLKAAAPLQSIPVIVTSNLAAKNIIDECLALGAVDFIIKAHINLSELAIRVKRALDSGG